LRNNTNKYLHKSGDMTNAFVMLFWPSEQRIQRSHL